MEQGTQLSVFDGIAQRSQLTLFTVSFQLLGPDEGELTAAQRALGEYLDTVPVSKIFGFGGDYRYVENSYSHLVIALQNIARTLAAKVETHTYTETQALEIGRSILYRNPKEFFAPERVAARDRP